MWCTYSDLYAQRYNSAVHDWLIECLSCHNNSFLRVLCGCSSWLWTPSSSWATRSWLWVQRSTSLLLSTSTQTSSTSSSTSWLSWAVPVSDGATPSRGKGEEGSQKDWMMVFSPRYLFAWSVPLFEVPSNLSVTPPRHHPTPFRRRIGWQKKGFCHLLQQACHRVQQRRAHFWSYLFEVLFKYVVSYSFFFLTFLVCFYAFCLFGPPWQSASTYRDMVAN